MDDRQLLRYSRHILLDEFGVEAQQLLSASHALVVGAGGLGSAALLYLASAGVGRITIADGDAVDMTNLQRQIVHRENSVGINKAESARRTLHELNSDIVINVVPRRLMESELAPYLAAADVVLDCSDNFATRHAINRACVQESKPLVSGAAIRFDGQITSFDHRHRGGPCYHCLFPDQSEDTEERCAVMGVFAPLVGIIGTMQAAEAIRLLIGIGEPLIGRLLLLEGLRMHWQCVKFARDPDCNVCSELQSHKLMEVHHVAA